MTAELGGTAGLFELDHIGVVVDDLEGAKQFVGAVLGLQLDREVELDELALRTAFFSLGQGVCIELIQVDDAEAREARLGAGNSARIEHIALRVRNLDEAVAALGERGVEVVGSPGSDQSEPRPLEVGDTLNLWTRPETSRGVVYQLVADRR